MAPSSPSNSSSSESSPTTENSSLFLSINARPEPSSPESEESPVEATNSTHNNHQPQSDNNNTLATSTTGSNKSSPSHDDEKSASSPTTNTKPGNSAVKKAVIVNSNAQASSASSSVIPQQVSSSTTNTTNTSTSGVTTNKPVLVQSKKAIQHQPMNAFLPPQLIHHPPQFIDPNTMSYQQPPVRVANGKQQVYSAVPNPLHYTYTYPGAHPIMQSQPPTAFYPSPHGSAMVHDATMYMPMVQPPVVPNSEADSSEGESEYSESDEEDQNTIKTMQKPSPYTEIKKKYEDLMKLYTKACKELTAAQAEISELKRKRDPSGRGAFMTPSASTSSAHTAISPVAKKKKTESPISEPIRRTDLIPLGVDKSGNLRSSSYQQLETSITSLPPPSIPVAPVSPSSDSSSSVSLNTLVYIYYYDGGCDGHGSRQLKANGKRIFIDINWDEIFKFRQDDCLHMCIFVNTSTVDKVKDSDLIATFKILRSDGDKVKISKIRENLRRLNLQNQFSHIGHIKFFIQIRGNDQLFDYTDKILLYSKTQHNIASFEPANQKEYNELSKLFYQPERFTVFKKV